MVSIRKLASIANVSPMTVSRVLRNLPGVKEETRQHILALAEDYHLSPFQLPQGVPAGATRTLGCIMPNICFGFYHRLLSSILQAAYRAEYRVIVLETNSDPERTRLALHSLIAHRVDGVMIDSEHPQVLSSEILFALQSNGVVPLCLDATPSAHPVHAVLIDEEQMAELAVSYLYGLGHRSIAYLGTLPQGEHRGRQERPTAVLKALRCHGLPQEYLFDPLPEEYYGQSAEQILPTVVHAVETIFVRLMTAPSPPTAFLTPSEVIAAYLLSLANRHGWHIPGDLSVLCMSSVDLADCLLPPLTSVDPHPEEIGRQAVKLLVETINRGDPHAVSPEIRRITPHLVERASCGPPSRR